MCYSNIIRFPPENAETKCFICFSNCGSTALFSPLLLFRSITEFCFSLVKYYGWHSSELFDVWIHLVAYIYNEIYDHKHDLDLL